MRCIMILVIVLLAGASSALPTPESEEKDGEVSRKILGSSVVTSVSVIMDVGNGSQTYFSDAVGKPMTKPATATQLASPINLLNPDRYEFYTFDDSGDLVKRLMTLDEIQGIIASGDGEASNYNSQSDEIPEKRVDDVVNNVQNVLKEEMEAHKTSPEAKPSFDTPDVSSTWSMILPAIFGNSGDDITPGKPIASATAETIMIEQTTLQPSDNTAAPTEKVQVPTEKIEEVSSSQPNKEVVTTVSDVVTETTVQDLNAKTESAGEIDAPIIDVEITSTIGNDNGTNHIQNDQVTDDTKTESSYLTITNSTTENVNESELLSSSATETAASISSTAFPSFADGIETTITSKRPVSLFTFDDKVTTSVETRNSYTPSTTSPVPELDASSTIQFYEKTNPPQTIVTTDLPPANEATRPQEQFSTFFLIGDFKQRPETTTTVQLRPSPFTSTTENIITTLSNLLRRTTTEKYETTTDEAAIKETVTNYPTTDAVKTNLPWQETVKPLLEDKITTTESPVFTSTQVILTSSARPFEIPTTELPSDSQDYVRFSTTLDDTTQQSNSEKTSEILLERTSNASTLLTTERLPISTEALLLTQPTTEEATTERVGVTSLLNQLLSTTNIYQINSELVLNDVTTLENEDSATDASTKIFEQTTINIPPVKEELPATNFSSNPENISSLTSDVNLVSSIEQLISQAVNIPEAPIESNKESEKINQMLSTQSKPMSEVQLETATAASALIGTTNTESGIALGDEQVNQAVDSLISQIIYQPVQATVTDRSSTTTSNEKYYVTTSEKIIENATVYEESTTIINEFTTNNKNSVNDTTEDDRNRYEEIDLGLDPSTINYESKTALPNNIETTTNTVNESEILFEKVEQVANQITVKPLAENATVQDVTEEQTTAYDETPATTEKLNGNVQTTTQAIEKQTTNLPSRVTPKIDLALEIDNENATDESFTSSTESFRDSTSKSNEILTSEATQFNQQKFNNETVSAENSSEPFLILATGSSSEYPDYSSTENVEFFTKNVDLDTTTSAEIKDFTEITTEDLETGTSTQALVTTVKEFNKVSEISNAEKIRPEAALLVANEEQRPTMQSATKLNALPNEESKIVSTTTTTTTTTTTAQPTTISTQHTKITPQTTQNYVNIATITAAPKIDKPPELKLIQNNTRPSTTSKPDMTWTLVSTVLPHKTTSSDEATKQSTTNPDSSVDLVPKPLQGFGLEDSTSSLDTDVFQFTELCNELAFSFWSSVTNGISFARSVIVSPFAATSMLAMVFLGARGATSGEMNEILKLDDMVTFNPHSIFKNVIESIEVSRKSGVATSVFVKELYSDKNKGKLLSFYKERVKQFYDGHVEEANFKEINDVIRRRTNLLVKRQTWGKIPEYLKDNNLFVRPPLAAVSANIFQTDCTDASTEGRDGELHFVVLPSIRQRKLIPIPAVVWRSGFLAGYDPGLDATAVAVGTKDQTISTIFIIPGQQGISAPGDGLVRLEARLIESAFRQGAWSRLLRSLIPRPGLEVQIPRFSHKSVINATVALQRMGLKDLFNSNTADLKGLNGVAHELYLSDIIQVNTFTTCGEGRVDETHHSEVYPATTNRSFRRIRKIQHYHSDKTYENGDVQEEPRDYQRAFHDPLYDPSYLNLPLQLRPRQARLPDSPRLRFDRPFLYVVRHNPTGLILHMGRFNPRLLP